MPATLELILRLLLAAVLGAIIGYQRERAQRPARLYLVSAVTTIITLVVLLLPHPIR
ncbi:MAG: hypothetical protein HYX84_04980 [Chloroflexi bacterium]|nr:hypothetical protein [Chloroflexota bacterium]